MTDLLDRAAPPAGDGTRPRPGPCRPGPAATRTYERALDSVVGVAGRDVLAHL
ncbi:MAG: hypothetical protein ABR511_12950 [Acidimicrobiales bacterium]